MVAKSTIEAKFRRSGIQSKRTRLWVDIEEDIKVEISKYFHLQSKESNIICFYKSSDYFLLFTTARIIVINNSNVENYFFNEIIDVRLEEIFDNPKEKVINDKIDITLKSGDKVKLLVEEKTWPVLYNIIKLLMTGSTN